MNQKIRTKLLGTVVLVTTLAGAAGLWNLVNLRSAAAAFHTMSDDELPATDLLAQADRDMHQALVAERSLMFLRQGSEDAAGMRKAHAENLAQVRERWGAYTAIEASEDERSRWPAFEAAFGEWDKVTREVLSLLAEDDPDARKDAIDITLSEGSAKFEAARSILNELGEQRLQRASTFADAVQASAQRTTTWTIAVLVGLAAAGIALGLLLARLVARPLADVVAVADAAVTGDLTRRVDLATRDELGQMAHALNRMLDSFTASLAAVRASATRSAGVAATLARGSEQLAAGTHEQASSLEETAASLEQMTATVRQSADQAAQAHRLASETRSGAETGSALLKDTVRAMDAISAASREIVAISTSIDEIAFQTNLLALNAAVEAARAGEQGRGFAVVAAEVRALSQRAATASKEIKSLILAAGAKVEEGSAVVSRSGTTLADIIDRVQKVDDLVGAIATAASEQAQGIAQVNTAVTQLDTVTQQTAAQSEELSSTAEALRGGATELEGLVARFTLNLPARGADHAPREARPRGARRTGNAQT